MASETIIYILIAGTAALLLALFQYVYNSKITPRLRRGLSILRFFTIFAVIILLINPEFVSKSYSEEKPNLAIVVDNSESIRYLKRDTEAKKFVDEISINSNIKDRFNVDYYAFGKEFTALDSLKFDAKQSNMYRVFNQLKSIYSDNNASVVFVSDGNQTFGQDYQYFKSNNYNINTVVLGDTTTYVDLSIKQVNVNRYVYLKNKFPVEIITNYSGSEPIKATLEILSGTSVVYSKTIDLDKAKTSEIVTANLTANSVGVQSYGVRISPIANERNTVNNIKNFAVEVIDQKTNVALVSDILHPDLGAIKKAIETNEQRSVTIIKPSDIITEIDDYQLFILYQPNISFKTLLSILSEEKRNVFIVTGNATDWQILNESQSFFTQEITFQSEGYQPILNVNYSPFIVEDINFEDFPPLQSEFGDMNFIIQPEAILYKAVNGLSTDKMLLGTIEVDGQKLAILNGEGIWKWRAHSFLEKGSFSDFDNLMGKLVQYLASNVRRTRMSLDYRSFYNGNENIMLNAQYFNKNFEFDPNASILVTLTNKNDNSMQEFPLLLKGTSYAVDLSGISPGDYAFVVRNADEPVSASGEFKVLEYNVEQQFLNADVQKLAALAQNNGGSTYFINETEGLISDLLDDPRFATIQKEKTEVVPLIDWKYLLGFIVLALSLEWYIRKYNGLI